MEGADEKYPPVLDARRCGDRVPIPMQSMVKHLECCNRYAVNVMPELPGLPVSPKAVHGGLRVKMWPWR
jgi:hypothetical protein